MKFFLNLPKTNKLTSDVKEAVNIGMDSRNMYL